MPRRGSEHRVPLPPTQEIKLFIALVHLISRGLRRSSTPVSNPSGPSYGKHLTAAEVSLTVAQAEGLFNTKFSTYTRSADGQSVIRALNYSLPSTVQQHILHVHPISAFTPPPQHTSKNTVYKRKATSDRRQLAPCEDIARPVCIQEFYGLPNKQTFLNEFRPDIAGNTFNITLLNEGQLDIQYTVGIAGDVPTTYLLDGSNTDAADFIHVQDTINWLLTQEEPPTVFTTSYGNLETDLTPTAATSVCNGYMQLAAIGISMIFASGDGGAANNDQEDCTSFVPTFPPTCPYVTSVGGTFFQPPTAFSSSSGGFSNLFPVPSWQAADTAAYLASIGDEHSGFYNPTGRGFPDVASEWEIFIVNAGGVSALQSRFVGGTSCASPIFASFIALVNDRLIAAGKPTLGFLNPLLYSTGRGGLDDVTVGGCHFSGWPATNGWDPVTGLGTPDFPGMLEALGI
ncbi:family S53 protease [Mycena olivaceomarginata]|nr:family S53 protease [Mycena olivaceomarginata]